LAAVETLEQAQRLLAEPGAPVDRALMQALKDKVASVVRVDIHQAVRLAEIARLATEMTDDPVGHALGAHTCAMASDRSGKYAEALDLYTQAETIYHSLGQEVEAARVARAKMPALMYLGRYSEALEVASRARQVLLQHGQLTLVAQVDSNTGAVYHRLDQYQQALECYQRAGEIFRALNDDVGQAFTDESLANTYSCLNEFNRAATLYQSARQIYERLGLDLHVIEVDYNLAWLLFLRGKFDEALAYFHRVKAASNHRGDTIQAALCDLDLAELYLQLNAYDDALESATLARHQFAELKMNYEYAKATMSSGLAQWHLNRAAQAEVALGDAQRLFQQEGNHIYTALCDLHLSQVQRRKHDFDRALALGREAYEIFAQYHTTAKAAYAQLKMAELHAERGDVKQAEALCDQVLKTINGLEAPWLKYQCHHLKGQLSADAGDTTKAYAGYALAIKYIEQLRGQIRVDEFKTTFLKDKLRVYEDMVELCLRSGSEDNLREAFAYVEAAKSRTLVDLLSSTAKAKATSEHREWHERWDQLREELDWFYNKLNQNDLTGGQRAAEIGVALRDEIRAREMELSKLLRRLQIEDPRRAEGGGRRADSHSAGPLSAFRGPQSALAEDETIIEYYMTGGHIHVFVLDARGLRVVKRISSAEKTLPRLRKLRFQLNKHVFNGDYVGDHAKSLLIGVNQHLQALHQELIDPLRSEIDGRHLVFIPHEFLHYVPFHALFDGREYLIDRHEISYAPSAGVLKLCADKPTNGGRPRAEGGFEESSPSALRHRPSALARRALIVGVPDEAAPYIHQEVEAVRAHVSTADLLLGEAATVDNFKRRATACRLMHLACHATFRQDNPLFSSLKLADSWLNFYDIFNLELTADLVTLSACQTGLNKVFAGDELVGLMRGFLYAGAPSLIVSLWAVHDQSSAEFMKLLYRRLTAGNQKRAALREAQLALRESYPNPYYWAPFVLMGKPR
jgi:tetratricopeptide (TPR) repeat protein